MQRLRQQEPSKTLETQHHTVECIKESLQSRRQHLTFQPTLAATSSGLREATWQGVLFRDNRAVGRLCCPTVSFEPVLEGSVPGQDGASGAAVQQCSLAFDAWVPAGSGTAAPSQPLRIPVDTGFQQAELSVQVIGRQRVGAPSFALPHRYSVHGRDLARQLQLELQRQGYIRRHQAARSAATTQPAAGTGPPEAPQRPPLSTVTIESGGEVERLLSVFEVADKPTWLKSLVCKFLVAEPAAEAAPQPAAHAASLSAAAAGEASSSGGGSANRAGSGSAVTPAAQRKQPTGRQPRAKKAGGRVQEEQQATAAAGGEPAPEAAAPSEAPREPQPTAVGAAPQQLSGKKGKKKKKKVSRAQADTSDTASMSAGTAADAPVTAAGAPAAVPAGPSEAPAAAAPPAAAPAPSQPRGRGQRKAPPRMGAEPWSPPAGRPRSVQGLQPPPGLHLAAQQESEPQLPAEQPAQPDAPQLQRQNGGQRGEAAGRAAVAGSSVQGRQARKGKARRALAGPPCGGSSSDISSLTATSGRPASSIAALSSRCSSPGLHEAGSPLVTPTAAIAASPSTGRRVIDTPEALRELTAALLPHEKARHRSPSRASDSSCSPPPGFSSRPAPAAAVAAEAAAAEEEGMREQGLGAAQQEGTDGEGGSVGEPGLLLEGAQPAPSEAASSPRSLSEPPSPSSRGLPPSDSQDYLSSATSSQVAWDSPRHSSQGWSASSSAESSASSFQRELRSYERQLRESQAAQAYHGRTQSLPSSPQQASWHRYGGPGAGGWSQPPSRLGPGAPQHSSSAPSADGLPPVALRGHGRPMNGVPASSWQQPDRRPYGSSSNSAAGANGLYGHGSGHPAPPNGTHPALYQQQRYALQQQQYLQAQQHQQSMLAALGHRSPQGAAASGGSGQDGWGKPWYDSGYQQHQAWAGGMHWQNGRSGGGGGDAYGHGHGRVHAAEAAPGGDYGRLGGQQWHPASAPASLTASPNVGPKRQGPLASPASPEPLQLQVVDSPDDGPDLERFLGAVTAEVVPASDDWGELTLADVWRHYEVPSLLGQEVVTLGGPRGPAAAYYLPYLSAVQLFLPLEGGEAGAAERSAHAAAAHMAAAQQAQQQHHQPPPPPGEPVYSYPGGLEEWPAEMRLAFQWCAAGHVGERVPLLPQLEALAGGSGRDHPLFSTRVADLHPCTWFSVMWLPLYRIPEAPLDARFLTYHSLASLWATAREARAAGRCPAPAKMPLSPFATLGGGGPAGQGAASTTPTAVCAFPGSPTASDAGTRTSSGRAPCSLASEPSRGRARSDSCGSGSGGSAHGSAGGGSAIPSPAASELGDPLESPGGGPAPATPRGGAGALAEPLPLPVVGLQWYTMPRSVENWVDTLVAAQLPEDMAPPAGTVLADGSRITGCWRGVAVVAKPYPVAKGGPMAWEVQLQELEQTAERLATGRGLMCRAPGSAYAAPAALRCPDHNFFLSRAWTCRNRAAAWARG